MRRLRDHRRGIVAVECLIALGMIVALMAVLLVALGPRVRAVRARNDLRIMHVRALSDAAQAYAAAHEGDLPGGLSALSEGRAFALGPAGASTQGSCPGSGGDPAGTVDLRAELVGTYLDSLPVDPARTGDASLTGYYARRMSGGRFEIGACHSEDEGAGFEPIIFRR